MSYHPRTRQLMTLPRIGLAHREAKALLAPKSEIKEPPRAFKKSLRAAPH